MKLCKVKIRKERDAEDTQTKFVYPQGYDSKVASPFVYQNEGKDEEYCLAHVPDGFTFTGDMVEVTELEAEALIDVWTDNDKDMKPEGKQRHREVKKQWLKS